jgi:hypothetical protein
MNSSGPSSSIIAAGVVGILASLFGILIAVAAIAGMSMIPQAPGSPEIPPNVKSIAVAMMFVFAGLAVFGIFTSVGVLRLKKWARISMLVWGGVMAAFCAIALLFAAFMPLPEGPATSPMSVPVLRLVLALIYGTPVLIGVWWLALFNQPGVKAQFLSGAPAGGQPVIPVQPRCPLPLAILAGFSIFSAGFSLLLPFINFPTNVILFGHLFHRPLGLFLFFLSAGIFLAGSIGLLRLKRWSYPLMLGQYFFWLASGTVTLVNPNYERNIQEMMSQMNLPEGPMAQAAFAQTRVFGALAMIPGVLVIWLLLYCHTRFEAACAAKQGLANHTSSP